KSAETAIDDENYPRQKKKSPTDNDGKKKRSILSPRVMDAVLTTVMGLAAVGLGGVFYQAWYEWNEVHKVEMAFKKPAPLLRGRAKGDRFFKRKEADIISKVMSGKITGKYFLLVGERGTGKTQLILNAMEKIKQSGVVFSDAHSDSEIFKVRLGKALRYTYREDYVGQLFAREAPERALNMVEAVAMKQRGRRPLILVINNIHAFKDDEEGEDLLELLQQRAESWAATKIRDASRMDVIRVSELSNEEAVSLLKEQRKERKGRKGQIESDDELNEIVEQIGGRLSYIDKLAKEDNIK
ncbi:4108_t:CDS:2, partial [Gigaspora rosea]